MGSSDVHYLRKNLPLLCSDFQVSVYPSFFPEIILQGIQPCEVLRVLIFHPGKGILKALFQLAWFRNLILMTSVMAMTTYYFSTSNAGRFLNFGVNFNLSTFLPFFFELFF